MAIAIKRLFFKNGQDENIKNAINTPIIKVFGSVRRTPGDSPLLKIYIGKRDEYKKNKVLKLEIDSNGDFVKTLEFQDDPGLYYITAELLLDNGSFDVLTENIYFKDSKPTIDNFDILNADSFLKKFNAYDTYFFNSFEKNTILVSFASNPIDSDLEYFYKIWLSSDVEPDSFVPISYGENSKELDISLIENGDYYIYFKVIDSAGNFTTTLRKVSIAKITPDVTVSYLQIVSNDYFVTSDKNSGTKLFRLLVDIRAGIKIKQAELRLFKDNKMITMKIDSNEFNKGILRQLQNSGSYFLEAIDISNWGLSYGQYEIEIFYKDVFNIEYKTNRVSIFVKDRQPSLYCNQLDSNNPATLILDAYTELDFYFEDPFFKFKSKQISVKKYNSTTNSFSDLVGSKNNEWEEIETGIFKTTLKLFLTDKEIKKVNNKFCFENYEFSLSNDYSDIGNFIVPLVYKAEKNKVILHDEFINPTTPEFQKTPEGYNVLLNKENDGFSLPDNTNILYLKLKIINDVNFNNFTTTENKILINNSVSVPFLDSDSFYCKIDFSNFSFKREDGFTFSLSTSELTHDSNTPLENFFNCSFFSSDNFVIKNLSFNTFGPEKTFLENIPASLNLSGDGFNSKKYNDFYQEISFFSSRIFFPEEFNYNEIKKISVSDNLYTFTPYFLDFNIRFYKELSSVFSNEILNELIYEDKIYYKKSVPFPRLNEELLFFIDSQKNFTKENVKTQLNNFSFVELSENSFGNSSFVFDTNKRFIGNKIVDSFVLEEVIIEDKKIKLKLFGDFSKLEYFVLDVDLKNKSCKEFVFSSGISENDYFVFDLPDSFSFTDGFEYKITFFETKPVYELVFDPVPVKNGLKNGPSSFNIFYKYKNLDEIFMFTVFYDVFTFKPSIKIAFDEEPLMKRKSNKLYIYNDTLRPMSYKSVEIFCNETKLLALGESFFVNKNNLVVPINVFGPNGEFLPNTMYSETSGIFSLHGVATFEDKKTKKIFTYRSDIFNIEVKDTENNYNLFFENNNFFDEEQFLNNKLILNLFEKYKNVSLNLNATCKRIKKLNNGMPVTIVGGDTQLIGNSFYNIKSSTSFLFKDFFNFSFESGVYEIEFTVTDSLTNLKTKIIKTLELNKETFLISVSDYFLNEDIVDFSLVFKNDFYLFSNYNLNVTFTDFETGEIEVQNVLINGTEIDVSFILPFKKNKVSFLVNNFFGKYGSFSFNEVLENNFIFDNSFCFISNLKLNELKINSENIFYYFGSLNDYILSCDVYKSDDVILKVSIDGIDFPISSENTVLVPNDSKKLSFSYLSKDEIVFYKEIEFVQCFDFFNFNSSIESYCFDEELFSNFTFKSFPIKIKIENLVNFFEFKSVINVNSFSYLCDKVYLELNKEQKMFLLFSSYEILKRIDKNVFKNEIQKTDFFIALSEELYEWLLIQNKEVPILFSKSVFEFLFFGFDFTKKIKLLKILTWR